MELKLILLLLPVVLLVELSIQGDPKAGEPKIRVAPRSRVRLCGDSLKRAIIYLCGGSRWKREEMDPSLSESVQTGIDNIPENEKLKSNSDPELKQPQGDSLLGKEPSWSEFPEYYMDDERNIPEANDNLANDPELEQSRHDRPHNTEPSWRDFLDVYNDDIAASTEDVAWESPGQKELADPIGSDAPQVKRKRDAESDMVATCCEIGCTGQELHAVFCQ